MFLELNWQLGKNTFKALSKKTNIFPTICLNLAFLKNKEQDDKYGSKNSLAQHHGQRPTSVHVWTLHRGSPT